MDEELAECVTTHRERDRAGNGTLVTDSHEGKTGKSFSCLLLVCFTTPPVSSPPCKTCLRFKRDVSSGITCT